MGIFQTVKSKVFSMPYFQMKKKLKIAMDGLLRPWGGGYQTGHGNLVYPAFPYQTFRLYDFAYNSDVLTSVHNSLRRELFRNGFDLAESENTEDTQSEDEVIPKGKTRKQILDFLEDINENGQNVMDVLMELEDDFSIMDDAFLLFINTYGFDDNGDMISKEVSQVMRIDPRFTGQVMNRYDRPGYNDDNIELLVCPIHRSALLEGDQRCPKCGTQCFRAHFFSDYTGEKLYYFKDEIIFKSKYRPSKRRGFSPVLSVWQKTRTLFFMDKYIMELYDGQRPPKAGLFFKTNNQAGLMKSWEEVKQKVADDPHMPVVMGIPDSSNGQGFVEFIDFMKGLDELQHTEMRNEYRRQIGSVYGVEPIFQGDTSQGGGLNNEGLQITVTNRAVEYGQKIYNTHFFPKILEVMGVMGWSIILNPSEEQDEMAKLDREQRTLQNGQLATSLGLEANYDSDTNEVIIEPGKIEVILPEEEPEFSLDTPIGNPATPSGTPGISKIKKVATRRPPFTKLANTLKKEIDAFVRKFKRRPSEEELKKAIAEINLKLKKELEESAKGFFKKTYQREADAVSKTLGINFVFETVDENALEVLNNQAVLSKAYNGIADEMTSKINKVIDEAFRTPKGLSTQKITDKIKEVVDVSDFRAEQISRTEIGKVSSAARKTSYQKERDFETFKFKHIGPSDSRTTLTSKRIKARTKNGVPWVEYVKIVEEESKKEFPEWTVNKDFPLSHYSSRHVFIRLV